MRRDTSSHVLKVKEALKRYEGALRAFRKLKRELRETEEWKRGHRIVWPNGDGADNVQKRGTLANHLEDAIDAILCGDDKPAKVTSYLKRELAA